MKKPRNYVVAFLMLTLLIGCSITSFATVNVTNIAPAANPIDPLDQTPFIPAVDNSLGKIQNQFNSSEINLTQGTVKFFDNDLKLPGKSGLDLVIGRHYDSKFYRSTPTSNPNGTETWSGWSGHGWSFSFAKRAFILKNQTEKKQIAVDYNGNVDIYNYDKFSNKYKSTQPGNYDVAWEENQSIIVQRADGKRYIFGKLFYQELRTLNWTFSYSAITVNAGKTDSRSGGSSLILSNILVKTGATFNATAGEVILKPSFQAERGSNFRTTTNIQRIPIRDSIDGYYLTEIRNLYDQSIRIEYENMGNPLAVAPAGVASVLDGFSGAYDSKSATLNIYRPTRIYDNFGKQLDITYSDSGRNSTVTDNNMLITGIRYPNINGQYNTLKYFYDGAANLVGVQLNDLPKKEYVYRNYSPEFKNYTFYETISTPKFSQAGYDRCVRNKLNSDKYHCQWDYNDGYPCDLDQQYYYNNTWVPNYCDNDNRWIEVNHYYYYITAYSRPSAINGHVYENVVSASASYLDGYLLQTIKSPLGSSITYEYQDALTKIPPTNDNTKGGSYTIIYETNIVHASIPVVTKKTVQEDNGKSDVYEYNYATDATGHFKKDAYLPPNSSGNAYAFTTVNVNNPAQLQDEVFVFNYGLPAKYTQGIFKTETVWDVTKNRELSVAKYNNNTLQRKTDFNSYDDYNNPLKKTITKGSVAKQIEENSYNYNYLNNNLVHLLQFQSNYDINNPSQAEQFFYGYNDKGLITDIYKGNSSAGVHLRNISYDSAGRPNTDTVYGLNGLNFVSNYSYLEGSTYKISKTVNNKTFSKEYDLNVRKLLKETDENNNNTVYAYDDIGRSTSITYPDGGQKTFEYSTDLRQVTTRFGSRSISEYLDSLGRSIFTDNPSGEEDVGVTYYFSDKKANICKGSNYSKDNYTSASLKEQFSYDGYLRQTSVTQLGWGVTNYEYTGNDVKLTDPLGRVTIKSNDEWGRLASQTQADNTTIGYANDVFGNITSLTDPKQIAHQFTYDSYSQLINTYYPGTAVVRNTNSYLDNGNLQTAQIFNSDGSLFNTYSYEYDSEKRLAKAKLNNVDIQILAYDDVARDNGKGKLTAAENDKVRIIFDYDNMGRTKRETKQHKELGLSYVLSSTYNIQGLLTNLSLAGPSGNLVYQLSYEYDSISQRLLNIKYGNLNLASYSYNPNGTISTLTYGNGINLSFTYERDVLLTSQQVKKSDQTAVYNEQYTYDAVGNITSLQQPNIFHLGQTLQNAFTYNLRDELTGISVSPLNQSTTYQYDNNRNRTQLDDADGRKSYSLNNNDQVITVTTPTSSIQYSYDAAGNLISRKLYANTNPGQVISETNYSYGYNDCLTQIKQDGTNVVTYNYDTKRQRVLEQTPQATKLYHWDSSGHIIGEGTPAQSLTTKYIYNGNQKIAMVIVDAQGNESIYYFVNNNVGTPVLIVDSTGTVVQKIKSGVFGEVENVECALPNEINYTGKKLDSLNNLYYFNQRYYDSSLGRFISEDRAELDYGNPSMLNRYFYGNNNPLRFVDEDGRDAVALNDTVGFVMWKEFGHTAVLIGNDQTGWEYFSKDGGWYSTIGNHNPPRFSSLSDFQNYVKPDSNYGKASDRYNVQYRLKTASQEDMIMLNMAKYEMKKDYSVHAKCNDLVRNVLGAASNINNPRGYYSYSPNRQMENLIKRNSNGWFIQDKSKGDYRKGDYLD